MLYLKNIKLVQFKNYLQQNVDFTEKIVGICGNNGIGKTNLLDAIYYLCFTKSYFTRSDSANVHHGTKGLRVEGNFTKNDEPEQVVCIVRENSRKEMLRNGEEYKRFSEHIGKFPAVMIAPDDVDLVTGISEVRRKFTDTLLCQLDAAYLQHLIEYNKILQQRNSLLKSFGEKGYQNTDLLDVLDKQLVKPGNVIFESRRNFFTRFLPLVEQGYLHIAGNHEPVSLTYYSQLLQDDFASLLKIYRQKDLMVQRSTMGVHKDDIELKLNDQNFKQIASQGQRKSLLFALKLQEFSELSEEKGFAPLILLDDVFEKLDAGRMQNLLRQVCESAGQVFITDTHRERLQVALKNLGLPFQLIEL